MELKDLLLKYLETNGLSISFASRKMGISNTHLYSWIYGKARMNTANIEKIKRFLDGNFLITTTEILGELQ